MGSTDFKRGVLETRESSSTASGDDGNERRSRAVFFYLITSIYLFIYLLID